MKLQTTIFLFALLLSNNNASAVGKDTLSVLTGNSQRFWNVVGSNSCGICLCANGDFFDFVYSKRLISCDDKEVRRFDVPSCNSMSFQGTGFRVLNGNIETFYKQDKCRILNKFKIVEMSDTSLCLVSEKNASSYYLAKDQATPITIDPELENGYEFAEIPNSNDVISNLIDSIKTVCQKEQRDWPESFQIRVFMTITDDGTVCKAEYITGTADTFPGKGSERYFYQLLLDRICQIRFIPARNSVKGESYFCEFTLPIKVFICKTKKK